MTELRVKDVVPIEVRRRDARQRYIERQARESGRVLFPNNPKEAARISGALVTFSTRMVDTCTPEFLRGMVPS